MIQAPELATPLQSVNVGGLFDDAHLLLVAARVAAHETRVTIGQVSADRAGVKLGPHLRYGMRQTLGLF